MLHRLPLAHRSPPSPAKRISLQPHGVADVRPDRGAGEWLLTGPKPRLALIPEHGHLPSGWVLLRGRLDRRGADFTAVLFAEIAGSPGQWFQYNIPVSLKGTVLQLVHLQHGVTRLEFQPMAGSGSFELRDFCIQKVNQAELFVRRALRVRHIFLTKPRERRQKIGLHWHTPLVSLSKSYDLTNRLRGHYPTLSYAHWQDEVAGLTRDDRRRIKQDVDQWAARPRFWLLVIAGVADVDRLRITLNSIQTQLYLNARVLVIAPRAEVAGMQSLMKRAEWLSIQSLDDLPGAGAMNESTIAAQDWVITLPPGAALAEHGLYWVGSAALRDPACKVLYSDHDHLDADGWRIEPEFKPDWSPELLRSSNYINSAVAVRGDVIAAVSEIPVERVPVAVAARVAGQGLHDYLLRVTERLSPKEIQHIPAVLVHLPWPGAERPSEVSQRSVEAVANHLLRVGIDAEVGLSAQGYCRVRYRLPAAPPMVSIIIPTRDALHHLRKCIDSVLSGSTYKNFEVLVVDNQSSEVETLEYLAALQAHPQVRVLRFPRPFNYSAINNFAVDSTRGEALCLLNNDTEVITPDWLEEMLGHLIQPDVGVVGAKLYFSDRRVQHAGDTVGPGGCAHHLHSFLEHDAPGYCGRAVQAQDLSAVTGACLLTWRKLYQELGGLDEAHLAVAFNDVDYCLRVREAQRRVVWTPYAELFHHESVSRGKDDNAEKIARAEREVRFMRKRWKHLLHHDPFYNPNLSYERPDFSLSHAPAISKPWSR